MTSRAALMLPFSALLLATAPTLAATTPAAIPPADVGNNPADPMLGGKDLGPSIACISTVQIRKTRVINEGVIMFQVGNRWYRNDMSPACTGLTSKMTIIDRAHGGQLCQGNIIDYVLPGAAVGMGTHQGSCMYGRFTPYMPPPPPAK
ncbi:hypothetical protein EUV02_12590 [Polymorphobacter arshaanensis]|uniref:Uncharacterized protein n=1 Tax=Glacieibacterium arshaanense TaxID=2511025 RepID=A0A4Y9EK33_9SPHN|nr:hypothetical protein [Polymorphobacter arshaanensis]TFU01142.1 hypothetical protein EUV02_12590 [Polymorphobacter arshaanensis]